MITAVQVYPGQCRPDYSLNEFPYSATLDEQPTLNLTSVPSGSSVSYDFSFNYGNKYSLKSYNGTANSEFDWNVGTAIQFTVERGGARIISFEVAHDQLEINYTPQTLRVFVSVNGTVDSSKEINIVMPANYSDMPRLKFFRFAALLSFATNDVVNIGSFGHVCAAGTTGGSRLWIDAACSQFDNRGLYPYGGIYQRPSSVLKVFRTIDFVSTPSGAFSDNPGISFPGAKPYDNVEIIAPLTPSDEQSKGEFSAWVTAADTITARYRNTTDSLQDPNSASYKLIIRKAP